MKESNRYWFTLTIFQVIVFLVSGCESNNKSREQIDSIINTDVQNLKRLADTKFNQNKFEEVIPIYSKLINIDSLNGEYHYKRGSSLASIYKYDNAARDYERAAELNYRVHDSYYNLGVIHMLVFMDTTSARLFFEKALFIKPNSKETLKMLDALERNSETKIM